MSDPAAVVILSMERNGRSVCAGAGEGQTATKPPVSTISSGFTLKRFSPAIGSNRYIWRMTMR